MNDKERATTWMSRSLLNSRRWNGMTRALQDGRVKEPGARGLPFVALGMRACREPPLGCECWGERSGRGNRTAAAFFGAFPHQLFMLAVLTFALLSLSLPAIVPLSGDCRKIVDSCQPSHYRPLSHRPASMCICPPSFSTSSRAT